MKLKLDENGHVVVQDGHPVYTHDDGKDAPFDAKAATDRISALNGESMRHRQGKEEAEGRLKAFEGLNVDDAKKALETVGNLKAGDLKTSDQVQQIKDEAKRAAEDQVREAAKANGQRIQELESKLSVVTGKYEGEVLTNTFANSAFLKDKVNWPADAVQSIFGSQFKIEDGKIVGYDRSGSKLFSRKNPGDLATFEEAIEMAVDQYPHRDSMLKGTNSSGGGGRQQSGGGGGGKTLSRSEFGRMSPEAQRKAVVDDKMTVVD